MSPPERPPRRAAAPARSGKNGPHDAALGRVMARLPRTESELQDGRLLGPLQLAELLALPLAERVDRIEREPRFRHAGLIEAACDRAELLLAEQPRKALAAAELAASAAAAARCPGRPARLSDLCARALGLAAEALCRLGQPALAGPVLEWAEASLAAGSGDLFEAAALHLRAARRAREMGEIAELLERLDEAEDLYRQLGSGAGLSRARLAQARVMGFGPPENWAEAARLARRALEGFDVREDPALAARARLQLAWNLADAGRPEEARSLLLGRRRAPAPGGRPEQLARLWVQARVALRLGRPAEAGPAFEAVAAGWRSLGRHRTAALAVLDRAEAHAAAGEAGGAASTVLELARSLERRRRLHVEGLAVLRGMGNLLDGSFQSKDGRPLGREDFASLACYLQLRWHRPLARQGLSN